MQNRDIYLMILGMITAQKKPREILGLKQTEEQDSF